MIATIAEGQKADSHSGSWGVEIAVRTVASLSADNNVVGRASLGHDALESFQCRFSFKRRGSVRAGSSSYKRRKIAFETGVEIPHCIEVKLVGVENDDDATSQVKKKTNSGKELIHVSRRTAAKQEANSSPMLRQDSPRRHGDISIARPVSLPNLHQSEDSDIAKDVGRQEPVNDDEGTNCIPEAQENSWEFKVIASVKSQNRNLASTDVIGTIAFERKNEYFATGGIARKIRVYAYESLTAGLSSFDDEDDEEEEEYFKQRRVRKRTTDIDHTRCCVHEVCTPAKLSSLQWHAERANLIACGDYDGVVTEWDVERTCAVSERDENGGQRIWSIDYSNDFPDLIASACDDGTVRMWDRGSDHSVAILTPPAYSSICCAEFGPASSSLIALASADSNVYLYDTRWLAVPILTLSHHKRAASYVRFLNRHSLVSSSIDSSVKLWDISKPLVASKCCSLPVKSFDSHYNVRNFTGLSVRGEGGLIACGSETNQAFVYEGQRSNPVFTHSFDYKLGLGLGMHSNPNLGSCGLVACKGSNVSLEHPEGAASNSLIVSAVCWRMEPNDCTLVAANSDGVLRILSGSISSHR